MNVTVLRTYAVQLEEVAKLELAELSHALQQTVSRMAMLESRAKEDADRYLLQVRAGSTVDQVYGHLDAMDQAIADRRRQRDAGGSSAITNASGHEGVQDGGRDLQVIAAFDQI